MRENTEDKRSSEHTLLEVKEWDRFLRIAALETFWVLPGVSSAQSEDCLLPSQDSWRGVTIPSQGIDPAMHCTSYSFETVEHCLVAIVGEKKRPK